MKSTKGIRSKIFKLIYRFVTISDSSNNGRFFQQGLALGNALSDPYNMLNYGDYAYQTGLVDRKGWRLMKIFEYLAKEHINDQDAKIV